MDLITPRPSTVDVLPHPVNFANISVVVVFHLFLSLYVLFLSTHSCLSDKFIIARLIIVIVSVCSAGADNVVTYSDDGSSRLADCVHDDHGELSVKVLSTHVIWSLAAVLRWSRTLRPSI